MSTLTSSTAESSTLMRRVGRWLPRGVAIVVLGWSAVELVGLIAAGHWVGAELYGLLVAILAVVAAIATLWLVLTRRQRTWIATGLVSLWAVVALGGLAGTVAHAVGPSPGHGPVDDRPRPAGAPLVFSALGVLGSGAVIADVRRRRRHSRPGTV